MFGGGYAESMNIGGGSGSGYCIDETIGQTRGGQGVGGGGPSGGPSGGADADVGRSPGGRGAGDEVDCEDEDEDDVGGVVSMRGGGGPGTRGRSLLEDNEGVKMSPVGEMSVRSAMRTRCKQDAKARGRKCIEILDIDSEVSWLVGRSVLDD
jgi:hypothetical protein